MSHIQSPQSGQCQLHASVQKKDTVKEVDRGADRTDNIQHPNVVSMRDTTLPHADYRDRSLGRECRMFQRPRSVLKCKPLLLCLVLYQYSRRLGSVSTVDSNHILADNAIKL